MQLHGRLSKVLGELQEEKVMNKSLRDNQQLWQKRVTSLETSVKELAESKERVGFNKSSSAVLVLYMCLCVSLSLSLSLSLTLIQLLWLTGRKTPSYLLTLSLSHFFLFLKTV